MTFGPITVEVWCVSLLKDHCVQAPWEYINVCGYSDQFCELPHTYYIHTVHNTYRMSDHIVSFSTQFKRDNKKAGASNVVPSYRFCFEIGLYVYLNATTFSYRLPKYVGSFDKMVMKLYLTGLQLDAFSPWAIVYCCLEFKLSYLKNQKLFSIRVKVLFEPIVLWRKGDGF